MPRDLLAAMRRAVLQTLRARVDQGLFLDEGADLALLRGFCGPKPLTKPAPVLLARTGKTSTKIRVTADGTLPGAACKGGDCGAMAVLERIRRSFAGRYSCSGLRLSLRTERDTCRKFQDPFTEAHNAWASARGLALCKPDRRPYATSARGAHTASGQEEETFAQRSLRARGMLGRETRA